jgi:hypothetical protein
MKKKIGMGSVSFLLFILAIVWSFNIKEFCLGDIILNTIGLPAWSGGNYGTHYTVFYSLIFLIPSIIIGYKYPSDLFAKTWKVALIGLVCFLVICLFSMMPI